MDSSFDVAICKQGSYAAWFSINLLAVPKRMLLLLLSCTPLAIMLVAWAILYGCQRERVLPIGFIALGVATANAIFASGIFSYYELRPAGFLPPWHDPEILNLGLLFLLAPVAMVLGVVAAVRGAPKWLMGLVELSSVPLLIVGLFAVAAV